MESICKPGGIIILASDAHNKLLLLIEEPTNVKKRLEQTGSDLTPTEKKGYEG
jgi:hypothetical protein